MAKNPNPKAYTAPHPVYLGSVFTNAGDVFVTDLPAEDTWEERSTGEVAAIDASSKEPGGKDADLNALAVPALQALAATKGVHTKGLDKAELITAIKAADEPKL